MKRATNKAMLVVFMITASIQPTYTYSDTETLRPMFEMAAATTGTVLAGVAAFTGYSAYQLYKTEHKKTALADAYLSAALGVGAFSLLRYAFKEGSIVRLLLSTVGK